jgi:hypothetical protein
MVEQIRQDPVQIRRSAGEVVVGDDQPGGTGAAEPFGGGKLDVDPGRAGVDPPAEQGQAGVLVAGKTTALRDRSAREDQFWPDRGDEGLRVGVRKGIEANLDQVGPERGQAGRFDRPNGGLLEYGSREFQD